VCKRNGRSQEPAWLKKRSPREGDTGSLVAGSKGEKNEHHLECKNGSNAVTQVSKGKSGEKKKAGKAIGSIRRKLAVCAGAVEHGQRVSTKDDTGSKNGDWKKKVTGKGQSITAGFAKNTGPG